MAIGRTRNGYTPEFRKHAACLVLDNDANASMKSIADTLHINPKTLSNWVQKERKHRDLEDRARVAELAVAYLREEPEKIEEPVNSDTAPSESTTSDLIEVRQTAQSAERYADSCYDLIRRMAGLIEVTIGEIIYLEERPGNVSRREYKRRRAQVIKLLKEDQKAFHSVMETGHLPEER